MAAIAVHSGHIWTVNAVVLEALVERLYAHCPHALGDQIADRVVHHRGGDAGLHAEAIGEIGGAIELAAADVDLALGGLAEGDDSRIEAMNQGAERQEIQGAFLSNIETIFHLPSPDQAL